MPDETDIPRLSRKDLELIERTAAKYSDEVAVSTTLLLDRLAERIDALEVQLASQYLEDRADAEA